VIRRVLLHVALAVIGLAHLVPFYLLIVLALRRPGSSASIWMPPMDIAWANFAEAWASARLGTGLLNTLIITSASITGAALVGLLAAYPLARRLTRGNGFVYGAIIACMMVPNLTILVPLYRFMVDIQGVNQRWAVILLHITFNLPMIVFLYAGSLRSIPREIDEAAMIDGAGRLRTLFTVLFPLLKPATAAAFVIVGISIWNDFNFSLFFLQAADVKTITVSMSSFFSQYNSYIERAAAGCLISSLPMVALFLAMQRYFIKGLATGAVKG